jgi:hypothetical protein
MMMDKSKNAVILSVIHHRQSPLEIYFQLSRLFHFQKETSKCECEHFMGGQGMHV